LYASHTFHEIQQPYHMRMIRDRNYKFIWNLNYQMTFPVLGENGENWASKIKNGELTHIGIRPVEDYLMRPQYELYDMQNDTVEINNLAYHPEYSRIKEYYLRKIHQFQHDTDDPWELYQGYDELQRVMDDTY